MHVLTVRDVNEALPRALAYLRDCGTAEQTRNGPALVAPGPVATVYRYPRMRVLFDAERDANPFFHLFESLWILAGRRDVAFLSMFNSRIADYSDDGKTFHAAYGYRLRDHFSLPGGADQVDQIEMACAQLKRDKLSRRAVLGIWDPGADLNTASKDLPCNDTIMLRVRSHGASFHPSKHVLDITVCNRSNDAIWGAYGANAVQFSFLQEYMAEKIGVGVGEYTQMSHNLHVYTENPYWQKWLAKNGAGVHVPDTPYTALGSGECDISGLITQYPDLSPEQTIAQFDEDLALFFSVFDNLPGVGVQPFAMAVNRLGFKTWFFENIATPMLWQFAFRNDITQDPKAAHLDFDTDYDWHRAGADWLARRAAAKAGA